MSNNQDKTSATTFYDMTPEQERLYDELDAQGGLPPDMIRRELGIGQAATVSAAQSLSRDSTDATVAKLERGSHYGPNRHIAPSDRDVETWAVPTPAAIVPRPKGGETPLWHNDGHLAATAALRTAGEERRRG